MKRFIKLVSDILHDMFNQLHEDFTPMNNYKKYTPKVLGQPLDEYSRRTYD